MRLFFGVLLTLVQLTAYSEAYRYPETVNLNVKCKADIKTIEILEQEYSYNQDCPNSVAKVSSLDLNQDGLCEYYVTSDWGRRCTPVTDLVKIDPNKITPILNFNGEPIDVYGPIKNGYPKLIHYTWGGHRTNIIFTANVYVFNGEKYVCEFCKDNSHGGYIDLAKKSYDEKDYFHAEIYYWNAYVINKKSRLSDANNLSLVYIKQKEYQKAINLLEKHLSLSDTKIKESESTPCYTGACTISDKKLNRLKSSAHHNKKLAITKLNASHNY